MAETHYGILGIARNSSPDEVKAAWREIAFRLHPDRNRGQASDKYKLAADAWNVLSDPAKRRSYDDQQYAITGEGLREACRSTGDHPFHGDVFNVLFEEAARMRGFFGNREDGSHSHGNTGRTPSYVRPHPILKQMSIPLSDAFTRPDVEVPVERWRVSAGGRVNEDVMLNVKVPIVDSDGVGTAIIQGEGHVLNRSARGDVKVAFNVVLEDGVRLCGDGNVEYTWTITLKESLTGFSIEFSHPNGKCYGISSKSAIVPPGHKHVMTGLGLERSSGQRGDFILVFNVIFPSELDEDSRRLIKEALDFT